MFSPVPTPVGSRRLGQSPGPVVGAWWVHDKRCSSGAGTRRRKSPTHYWALRQQARGAVALCAGGVAPALAPGFSGVGFLLLPCFGGGVWCLICG